MLPAKLFAILTILPLGAALLEGKPTPQSVDMYVHTTYFVVTIGERRPQIEMALVTGCFALIYFAAARWVKHPLNNFSGSCALCDGDGWLCGALTVRACAQIYDIVVRPGRPSTDSMAVLRVSRWRAVFPHQLRRIRDEYCLDRR